MSKQLFILFSLFIFSYSQYLRPMKKDSKYGDDVCRYIEDGYEYVKPCEKGKYCLEEDSTGSDLYICQPLPEVQEGLNILNDKCSSDFDCEMNLKCISGVCSKKCPSTNESPVKDYNNDLYDCKDTSTEKAADGICFLQEYDNSGVAKTPKYGNPTGKGQICGLYSNFYDQGNQNYILSEIKYAYIGSVENGNYVSDEILCKSGFALYYYPKGNLQDPYNGSSSFSNNLYKMCVTPIAIEHNDPLLLTSKLTLQHQSSCVIYYKEKDEDTTIKKYNVEQLTSKNLYSSSNLNELCHYSDYEFKIKFQHFKEYTTNLKEEQRDKCGDLRTYSEYYNSNKYNYRRYSCDNSALIKSWYFYTNPRDYIVYNNREKLEVVLNYLIQKDNPSYEFSHILNINYLIYLLFLLFL